MPTRRSLLASFTLAPLLPATGASAQDASEDDLIEEVDIVFAEVEPYPLELDAFYLALRAELRPAIVLLPGFLDVRRAMHEHARAMAQAGYVAMTVDYRRGTPGYLADARAVVRWIRANAARFGVDPERIGTYGYSAGGHLAALLGVRGPAEAADQATPALADYSSDVQCVVSLAGVSDMLIPNTATLGIGSAVLGTSMEQDAEGYRALSPISYVDAEAAPFMLIHGSDDTLIPADDSQAMATALQDAGVEVVFAYLGGVDHFDVDGWGTNGSLALAFFARHQHPEQ
jgi:acetyl esterase/lipase